MRFYICVDRFHVIKKRIDFDMRMGKEATHKRKVYFFEKINEKNPVVTV